MSIHYQDPLLYRRPRHFGRGKRRGAWSLLLIFLFVIGGFSLYLATRKELPIGTINLFNAPVVSAQPLPVTWPKSGHAAIGTSEDGVLAQSIQTEQPKPIASLAKVITALAVLEKAPLQPDETGIVITLDLEDELLYQEYLAKLGTVTAVTAGERINQYQALQAMLLPSSNNMSDSLVRRIFGSMEAYTAYANDMVKRYGLTKTHIADASGFSPQTVSTPSELVIIGQKALAHPVIANIVAQKEAEIPLAGVVPNYNSLLRYEGVTGIKPGNTDEAGWCLLFSATYDDADGQPVTLIGAVLGQSNPTELFESSREILASSRQGLKRVEIVRGGEVVGTYRTKWGQNIDLVAQESLWAYAPSNNPPAVNYEPTELSGLLPKNYSVGSLSIQNRATSKVEVVTQSATAAPSLLWRLKNTIRL